MLTGKEDINYGHLFTLESSDYDLRGHQLKLYKHHNRLNDRKFFFTQRVISAWNSLPSFILDASIIREFIQTETGRFLEGYGQLTSSAFPAHYSSSSSSSSNSRSDPQTDLTLSICNFVFFALLSRHGWCNMM